MNTLLVAIVGTLVVAVMAGILWNIWMIVQNVAQILHA